MSFVNMTNINYETYSSRFPIEYTFENKITFTMRALGTFSSIINIFILAHRRIMRSSNTFLYLFFISLADFGYLGLLLMSNVLNKLCSASSTKCGLVLQYISLFLVIAVNDYLSWVFFFFSIFFLQFCIINPIFM